MIPFLEQPSVDLGLVTIRAFGVLVATGILIGMQMTQRFCKREGLDEKLSEDQIWYSLVSGFIISHIFDTVVYYPEKIAENPLVLLKIWDGISSFGGIFGGMLGMLFFFKIKHPELTWGGRLKYIDSIAYGFPFAWIFGRLGCTLANDHPGKLTHWFTATSLKTEEARDFIKGVYAAADRGDQIPADDILQTLGFHNLGFYEFLYTLLFFVPMMVLLGRKKRAPGFYLAAFMLLYTPVRFSLDFLRMADVRYFGLTPGQYAAVAGFLLGGVLAYKLRNEPASSGVIEPRHRKGEKKGAK